MATASIVRRPGIDHLASPGVTHVPRPADRPVVIAVIGALVIAWSAILVRLADVSPSTAAVFRCAYALPLLGYLAALEQRRFGTRSRRERMLAMLAGLFLATDLICWHHAIGDVGAGLATVLANVQIVLVAALAWVFLAERPARQTLAAIPVVLVGVVLISGVIGAGEYGRSPARGALFGLLAGLAYAGFILVLRQAGHDLRRLAAPLFDATLSATAGTLVAGLAIGDLDLLPSWPAHGWLLLLALSSQVLGWMLISFSLPRLPAALTSVLLTIQPVASVLLGVIIFAEAPSPLQFVGVIVVLGGVTLANVRRRTPRGPSEVAANTGPPATPAPPPVRAGDTA
jgi:drug/metabolite transporter (DMT)-like permease